MHYGNLCTGSWATAGVPSYFSPRMKLYQQEKAMVHCVWIKIHKICQPWGRGGIDCLVWIKLYFSANTSHHSPAGDQWAKVCVVAFASSSVSFVHTCVSSSDLFAVQHCRPNWLQTRGFCRNAGLLPRLDILRVAAEGAESCSSVSLNPRLGWICERGQRRRHVTQTQSVPVCPAGASRHGVRKVGLASVLIWFNGLRHCPQLTVTGDGTGQHSLHNTK